MKIIRTLAGIYAALFLFVVALGYIPDSRMPTVNYLDYLRSIL